MSTIIFNDAVVVATIPVSSKNLPDSLNFGESLTYILGSNNYYGTLEKGNLYFEQQLNSLEWLTAESSDKIKALTEATRMIDNLDYIGTQPDNQKLQFPRDFQTSVPEAIEQATYEISLKLLKGFDPDALISNIGVTVRRYSSIETDFDSRAGVPENLMALIPSIKAWYLLKPYLNDNRSIVLQRV